MKRKFCSMTIFIASLMLFTSCFTYTDILKKREVPDNYIFTPKDFEIGKKYEFSTKEGMVLLLRLNELSEKGVYGSGTLKTMKGDSQPIKSDSYFLGFEEMDEAKRYKLNPWLTALIPSVILVGVGIYASNNLNVGYTW